jgi:hypothetical protein
MFQKQSFVLHGCAEEAQGIILLPLSWPKACNCLESHQCTAFKEIHSALLKTSNCKVIVVGQPSSSLRLLQGRLLQGTIPSAFITLKMGVVAGDCWCRC